MLAYLKYTFSERCPSIPKAELDRNSELQRFDTDTNEIGGSKAHSKRAGGSARTRSRSDRNVMQRQAPGYYPYRVEVDRVDGRGTERTARR